MRLALWGGDEGAKPYVTAEGEEVDPSAPWPDFVHLDATLAASFGLTPSGVDRLSLRDVAALLLGSVRKRRGELQTAALVSTFVFNYGGFRPKGFRTRTPEGLFPELFKTPAETRASREEERAWWEEQKRKEAAYMAQVEARRKRLAAEGKEYTMRE